MVKSRKLLALLAAPLLVGALAQAASAASVTFTGSTGSLAAAVDFNLTGTTLTITLRNTAITAASANPDFLSGVYWHSNSAIGGTYSSVALFGSSFKLWSNGTAGTPTDGDEEKFGYANAIAANTGPLTNQQYGVSSAGLGLPYVLTRGLDGSTGGSPQGPDGGLVPTSGVSTSDKKAVIENGLVYTITGVNAGFALTDINNIRFQYGTSFTETSFVGSPPPVGATVPVPAAAYTGMALLAGLGAMKKLRRRA